MKWSNACPVVTTAGDAYYFVRREDRNEVVVMGFSMGKAWLNGVSYEPSEMRSHLFLGPLQPEDFEQFDALRKAATDARELITKLYDADAIPTLMQYDVDTVATALRRALGKQQ